MKKRNVKFSALLKLIISKRPISIIGMIFIVFSFFTLIIMVLIISTVTEKPFESYNHQQILRDGVEIAASITNIEDVTNISVNGEHPRIIGYQYNYKGQLRSDRFQTLELDKVADYAIGDSITIKSTGMQSVISGIAPYRFPFWLMYIIPIVFLLIGSTFLLIATIPAIRIYNLYKNGIVKDAEILAITRNSGMPISNIGRNILIDYHYVGRNGKKLFGSASTTDIAFLHENKAGSTVKIFVSETDEQKSTIVPLAESAKNNWNI